MECSIGQSGENCHIKFPELKKCCTNWEEGFPYHIPSWTQNIMLKCVVRCKTLGLRRSTAQQTLPAFPTISHTSLRYMYLMMRGKDSNYDDAYDDLCARLDGLTKTGIWRWASAQTQSSQNQRSRSKLTSRQSRRATRTKAWRPRSLGFVRGTSTTSAYSWSKTRAWRLNHFAR